MTTGGQISKGSVNIKLQECFLRPPLVLKYKSLSYLMACITRQDIKDIRCDNRKHLRTFLRNSSRLLNQFVKKCLKQSQWNTVRFTYK